MSHGMERPYRRALLGFLAWSCCSVGTVATAQDGSGVGMTVLDASRDLLRAEHSVRGHALAGSAMLTPDGLPVAASRAPIDLSPVLDEIFGFFHHHGVPLQEQLDDDGNGPVGVYADFHLRRDTPAVSFHLGDRSLDPVGAFYSSAHGFRCAVVVPVDRFTLRLEAGDDSELGYFGIAGVQWVDPHWPLAIGIGLPMNLRGAGSNVGVVIQLRMKLN
jgi:hypothetical protein